MKLALFVISHLVNDDRPRYRQGVVSSRVWLCRGDKFDARCRDAGRHVHGLTTARVWGGARYDRNLSCPQRSDVGHGATPLVLAVFRRERGILWAPEALKDLVRDSSLCMVDLDTGVWKRLCSPYVPESVLDGLARILNPLSVALGEETSGNGVVLVTDLERLPMRTRTRNKLRSAGFWSDPVAMAEATISDLMALPYFGRKSLLDFLSLYEAAEVFLAPDGVVTSQP